MYAAILAVALATTATKPISLAAPNLSGLKLDETAAVFYSQHFAQQLAARGVQVTTAKQIQTLVGFERQKQLLGCSEEGSSCLTELANALGVDGIITGDIGRFDRAYQYNIKIISARDGKELAAASGRVDGEEPLLDELTRAARKMAPELAERIGRPLAPPSLAARTADLELAAKSRRVAWVPFTAAAILGAGGALGLAQAQSNLAALRPARPISTIEAARLRDQGSLYQTLGFAALGLGTAALLTGGAVFLLNPDPPPMSGSEPVRMSLSVGPGGLSFAGVLP